MVKSSRQNLTFCFHFFSCSLCVQEISNDFATITRNLNNINDQSCSTMTYERNPFHLGMSVFTEKLKSIWVSEHIVYN